MECIYITELNENKFEYFINESESNHLKVLRANNFEEFNATNGNGLFAWGKVILQDKKYIFIADKFQKNYNENSFNISIGIAILSNKERFEMQIEKAVEFGVSNIIPIYSDYSNRKPINIERLNTKIISASKQCKRSRFTNISEPINLKKINFKDFNQIILMDQNGVNDFKLNVTSSILTLVGPEGGFSDSEIEFIKAQNNVNLFKLSDRRLRAETASFAILSIINLKLQNIL